MISLATQWVIFHSYLYNFYSTRSNMVMEIMSCVTRSLQITQLCTVIYFPVFHLSVCKIPMSLNKLFIAAVVGVCIHKPKYIGKQSSDCFFIQHKLQCCGRPLEKYMADILVSRDTLSRSFPVFLAHCAVTAVLIYFLLVELGGRKHNFRGRAQPKFTAGRREKIFSHSKPLWGCQRRCDTAQRPLQNQHTNPTKIFACPRPWRSCAKKKIGQI